MWNSGMMHSRPIFKHLSHTGAPSSRRHLILLLRQFKHAACLIFILWAGWLSGAAGYNMVGSA